MKNKIWLKVVDVLGEWAARVIDVLVKVVVIGAIGGGLIVFAPWVIDPNHLGTLFAQRCIEAGQCDFYSNLIGFGLGVFLVVAIIALLITTLQSGPRSLNNEVLETITQAGANGITAARIALVSDIASDDVMDIITCLLEEGQIVRVRDSDKTFYRLAEPA